MARYIREVQLDRPADFVQFIMADFLNKHGFKLEEEKGEMVYHAGGGLVEIPKFLTWGYQNGVLHIEAWTKNCWLPGVYGKEKAMTGFIGCVPKNAYKKDIEDLIGLMYQPLNTNGQPGMAPNQGQPGMNMQQPVYVRGADMSRYAPMALVFSILGFLFTLIIVIIGILFGTMGIVYGKKAMTSQKKGMATAAFVIGIIDVIFAVVVWILNIILLTM